MTIDDYLNEIELAVKTQLPTMWEGQEKKSELEEKVYKLTREVEDGYRRAQYLMEEESPDDIMLGAGIYWDTYFEADKEHHQKSKDLEELKDLLSVRAFSVASLAGSVLHYSKQGISIFHGGKDACPDGRSIGSLSLKTIIWEGRNQAIHWEEGNPRQAITDCFTTLEAEQDPVFGNYETVNLAFEVIQLLEWKTFDDFATDMRLFSE